MCASSAHAISGPVATAGGYLYALGGQSELTGWSEHLYRISTGGGGIRPVATIPASRALPVPITPGANKYNTLGLVVQGATVFISGQDGIHAVSLDGGSERAVRPPGAPGAPIGTLTANAAGLYWIASDGVWSSGLDGQAAHLIIASPQITDIAVSDSAIFYTVATGIGTPSWNGHEYEIGTAALDGSGQHTLYAGSYPHSFTPGATTAAHLVLSGSQLIIANTGIAPTATGGFLAGGTTGGAGLTALTGTLPYPLGVGQLAADQANIYWTRGADIITATSSGANPHVLLSPTAPRGFGLTSRCVVRVPTSGIAAIGMNITRGLSAGVVRLSGSSLQMKIDCYQPRGCHGVANLVFHERVVGKLTLSAKKPRAWTLTFKLSGAMSHSLSRGNEDITIILATGKGSR